MEQKQSGRWRMPSAAVFLLSICLSGCDAALLDPKGVIGQEQRGLILTAVGLMLIVVIPAIVMTIAFAWKYRASNTQAAYTPDWAHSTRIETVVWTIPLIIILILAAITWKTSHTLDPRNPLPGGTPLRIEVVAMDWKWLFIYPNENVAAVNEVALPLDTPVEFHITSQTVMNSFFIPQLGSQLYAMAGMENRLHLIASETGDYHGISANYSGHGFSGMNFTARAMSAADFQTWLARARETDKTLDWEGYRKLIAPSQNHPVTYFSAVKPGLYRDVINQYMAMGGEDAHAAAH